MATDAEIIAAYKEDQHIGRVAKKLKIGTRIVIKALDENKAGRKRHIHQFPRKQGLISAEFMAAVRDYKNNVLVSEIEKKHNVSSTQLYRWLDRLEIKRRQPTRRPRILMTKGKWWCLECGIKTPDRELFCCDDHRREFRDAQGADTEFGALYCLYEKCGKPLPFGKKHHCDKNCQRAREIESKKSKEKAKPYTPPYRISHARSRAA
jgi:hypothetical protein